MARGINLPDVSLVINYDLPVKTEEYFHRIGRSGRFESKGLALTLLTDDLVGSVPSEIKATAEFASSEETLTLL